MFSKDPSLFATYHQGFRRQTLKWPVNPVDVILKFLKKHPKWTIADLGKRASPVAPGSRASAVGAVYSPLPCPLARPPAAPFDLCLPCLVPCSLLRCARMASAGDKRQGRPRRDELQGGCSRRWCRLRRRQDRA